MAAAWMPQRLTPTRLSAMTGVNSISIAAATGLVLLTRAATPSMSIAQLLAVQIIALQVLYAHQEPTLLGMWVKNVVLDARQVEILR